MAVYDPVCHPQNTKIVYGPKLRFASVHIIFWGDRSVLQLRFSPYDILGMTHRSINCYMALSALNYLYNSSKTCTKFI